MSTGASPAYREAGNPKARAAGKAVRAGVAEEEERWQPAGLGTARRPVQNFRLWPASHVPGAKPLPLYQVSSRVWPGLEVTWMLDPGPEAQLPRSLPGPAGHGLSRLAFSPRCPHFPSPRYDRCWRGRGFWPSVSHLDICLVTAASVLYDAYKKLSSQSLSILLPLPSLFLLLIPGFYGLSIKKTRLQFGIR